MEQFVSRGMIADFAVHDKGDGNPHAHIMLTMRAMDEKGKWLPKAKECKCTDIMRDKSVNNPSERMEAPMVFKVRLFADGNMVKPEDYSKIRITAPAVDRIVNSIFDAESQRELDKTA